jgi:hypothetical protein
MPSKSLTQYLEWVVGLAVVVGKNPWIQFWQMFCTTWVPCSLCSRQLVIYWFRVDTLACSKSCWIGKSQHARKKLTAIIDLFVQLLKRRNIVSKRVHSCCPNSMLVVTWPNTPWCAWSPWMNLPGYLGICRFRFQSRWDWEPLGQRSMIDSKCVSAFRAMIYP